jgi:hypothetical protein
MMCGKAVWSSAASTASLRLLRLDLELELEGEGEGEGRRRGKGEGEADPLLLARFPARAGRLTTVIEIAEVGGRCERRELYPSGMTLGRD